MERCERSDAHSPFVPEEQATNIHRAQPSQIERILAGFSYGEQQRLRYLRQLYERGKLTEFPQRPRL
jgi:hypothetical protein